MNFLEKRFGATEWSFPADTVGTSDMNKYQQHEVPSSGTRLWSEAYAKNCVLLASLHCIVSNPLTYENPWSPCTTGMFMRSLQRFVGTFWNPQTM